MSHPKDRRQRLKIKADKFNAKKETRHTSSVWKKLKQEQLQEKETFHELREYTHR